MQRILVSLPYCQLDPFIAPQAQEYGKELSGHRFIEAQLGVVLARHHFGVFLRAELRPTYEQMKMTYNVFIIFKNSFTLKHSYEQRLESLNQIVEQNYSPMLPLRFVETPRIDDAHLL